MLKNADRRGFAIPFAVLVIALLTIMLAGGFSLVSAERRSVADQKSQVSAFRIAEQGIELYLVRRDSLMKGSPTYTRVPGASESIRINMTGGYADVSLRTSTNGGATWTAINAPHSDQHSVAVGTSGGKPVVFVGNDMISTVTKIGEEDVPASVFDVPADYKEVPAPGMPK